MIKRIKQIRRPAHWLIACVLLAESGLFVSCNGYDLDSIMPDWLGSSIYDYLNNEGIYTNEVRLINDLNYKDVLSKTGSKTLFVSDDEAFKRFYSHNSWGVHSYEDLSLAQKKILLNGAMINDAYQTRTLSSTPPTPSENEPQEGTCMRRPTAYSVYDSVPFMMPADMPAVANWDTCRAQTGGILCLKDMTQPPMIHFLEKQLNHNQITNDDYNFLFNNTVQRQAGDANINGVNIVEQNIKCMNGFVHKTKDVLLPLNNMAEIILNNPKTSAYSALLERFSVPEKNATATLNYNRIYNKSVESVYQKRYLSKRSQNDREFSTLPNGKSADGLLKFDPGWNTYFASTVASTGNDIAMQENMGVMIVPSNAALEDYFDNKEGKVLKNRYTSWEKVPETVIAKLINNNMLNSFTSSVPSKFSTVLNDATNEMRITKGDIDSVILGCNGAVYVTNKVFSPTAYSSVSFPALVNENMKVLYWGIEVTEYFAYLNSMEAYYSFFIPKNTPLYTYVDPVSKGKTATKQFRFYYDEKAQQQNDKVKASIWSFNPKTGVYDSTGMATFDMIKNRMRDLLDQHIVIGNIESGNEYYQTKSGAYIRVKDATSGAGQMKVSGGYQIENNQELNVSEVYDESANGNGKTYILDESPILTSKKSVYDVLSEDTINFRLFIDMLDMSGLLEKTHKIGSTNYSIGSATYNIGVFDTYQYTIYAPTNESIQILQQGGFLPTKEQWDAAQKASNQDSITAYTKRAKDFVRYHIQDNSVLIGAGNQSGKFETALIDPTTGVFNTLSVTANNDGISLVENNLVKTGPNAEQTVIKHVTSNKKLRNLFAREYQFNNADATKATQLETSSYIVIHQIDGPLLYSKAQRDYYNNTKKN